MRAAVVFFLPLVLFGCSKTNKLDGFEGAITMHTTSATATQDMVVEVKKDQLRFDMTSPNGGAMHGVFNPAANKVVLYADATKTYTDMNFSGASGATDRKSVV